MTGSWTTRSSLRHFALAAVAAVAASLASTPLGPEPAEARPTCAGKKATKVGTKGNDVIRTRRNGRDVIVARGGNDRIFVKRGRDVVCAGPGNDVIYGGQARDKILGGGGNDFVHGSVGKDKLIGGPGADTLVGAGGGDHARGGGGADRLLGGIQDDKLWGGPGADVLIGGHGIDVMVGGGGPDWMRGDTNADTYKGMGGSDTLSFATATPPGPNPSTGGVIANLARGNARGDDSWERIRGVENLIGSPFSDQLTGRGGGYVEGGLGSDSCRGFSSTSCRGGTPSRATAYVVGADGPDPGVVLFGGGGNDDWKVTGSASGIMIGGGSRLTPGQGCRGTQDGVFCGVPRHTLGYILGWGADGHDSITVGRGIWENTLIKLDGGGHNDVLGGSKHADLLYAGEGGADLLLGRGGDDALVARAGGADRLFGGNGNDNLVTDSPCAGHLYNGGRGGADVAGFAHLMRKGVVAKIGGRGRVRGSGCRGTRIKRNLEVLEGTRRADILIASRRSDFLIGRKGRDRCIGGHHRRC